MGLKSSLKNLAKKALKALGPILADVVADEIHRRAGGRAKGPFSKSGASKPEPKK